MFRGYFDDSGSHTPSPAIVIGGFVGDAVDWLGFDEPWEAVLADFGLSFFHMTDWSNKAPPYDALSYQDRENCLNRLLSIVANRRQLVSVGVAISMTDYATLLSDAARKHFSPYALASQFLFTEVCELFADDDADGKIDYVFENGAPGSSGMKRAFDESIFYPSIKREFHLNSLSFQNKRESPALQAADIMAYEIYREFDRPKERKLRYPLRQMIERLPRRWTQPNATSIRHWGQEYDRLKSLAAG